MKLPEFGVKRPVTNLMIFCAIIVIALYSFTRIGIDSFPKIEPPIITVISAYPGASPEDVEIKVTEPWENQLATTPGLEKITSQSTEGTSVISLKFIWGTNLDAASNDVRDRLELAKRFLPDIPDEMDNPFIFKFNTASIPILFMGITAQQSYSDLYDLIDKRVGDALRQLPGVGTVQIFGGIQRQINIWLDRQRLEGYGLSVLDIQDILRRENISQPLGKLKTGLCGNPQVNTSTKRLFIDRLGQGVYTITQQTSLILQNTRYIKSGQLYPERYTRCLKKSTWSRRGSYPYPMNT